MAHKRTVHRKTCFLKLYTYNNENCILFSGGNSIVVSSVFMRVINLFMIISAPYGICPPDAKITQSAENCGIFCAVNPAVCSELLNFCLSAGFNFISWIHLLDSVGLVGGRPRCGDGMGQRTVLETKKSKVRATKAEK